MLGKYPVEHPAEHYAIGPPEKEYEQTSLQSQNASHMALPEQSTVLS